MEKVLNSDDPDLVTIYNNLGSLYKDLNEKKKVLERCMSSSPSSTIAIHSNRLIYYIIQLALKPIYSDASRSDSILTKKASYNKYFISGKNSKIIVPFFQCYESFPEIYTRTKKHLKIEVEYPKYKCYEKISKRHDNYLSIFKEIKYYKSLSKNCSMFPKIYYFSVMREKGIIEVLNSDHPDLATI
ncbi:hypothetical protein SteCoe_39559 [Stentor coeruleus]|nr:hypothetical protein SteCoe_39559 [Stentor coeruleus]